jgi:hypothetical protein
VCLVEIVAPGGLGRPRFGEARSRSGSVECDGRAGAGSRWGEGCCVPSLEPRRYAERLPAIATRPASAMPESGCSEVFRSAFRARPRHDRRQLRHRSSLAPESQYTEEHHKCARRRDPSVSSLGLGDLRCGVGIHFARSNRRCVLLKLCESSRVSECARTIGREQSQVMTRQEPDYLEERDRVDRSRVGPS